MSDTFEEKISAAEKEAKMEVETMLATLLEIDAVCDKNMLVLSNGMTVEEDIDEEDCVAFT